MPKSAVAACVESAAPRRLHAPEAVVIIVIVLTGAALSLVGFSAAIVLQVLGGAGLIAGATITLTRTGLGRGARAFLRALAVSAPVA